MSSSASASDGPPAPPRTLVVGAGAIGGYVAARLVRSGWPVQLVARGATLGALRDAPMHVTDGDVEFAARIPVVAAAADADAPEVVLVAVKSYDTAGVGRELAPVLPGGATILSLQNGVDNHVVLQRECPEATVGGVAVYLGCQRTAPDHVVRRPGRDAATGAPRDRLAGGGPGAAAVHLRVLGDALGLPTDVRDDPLPALWTKLVANASLNTVTALGRARVGAVFAHPRAVELMLDIGREVVAVARAAGVDVAPDAADAYVADARRRLPPTGGSSTLFDLEAGRRLEREAMIGTVVREGDRLGVPVPVSRVCAALLELADPRQAAEAR